jgi:hypothetical protein
LEDPGQTQLDLYGQLGLPGGGIRNPAAQQRTKTVTHSQDKGVKAALTHQPSQMLPFADALREMPEFQDYWSGLQEQSELIDQARAQPSGLNLSPVMGLADYFAKGRGTALKSYTAPESSASRLKAVMDAQQKAQDDKRDMLKQIISAMALARSGGFETTMAKTTTKNEVVDRSKDWQTSGAASNFDPLKFRKGFETSKVVEPVQAELKSTYEALREMQGDPNWFKSRNLQALIVSVRGMKPVSDRDYKIGGGGEQVFNQAHRLMGKYIDGTGDFTEEDLSIIKTHLKALAYDREKNAEKLARQFAEGVVQMDTRAQRAGITPEQAFNLLKPYPEGFVRKEDRELGKTQFQKIMEAVEKGEKAPKAPASPTPSLKEQVEKAKKGLPIPDIKKALEDLKKPKRTDQ